MVGTFRDTLDDPNFNVFTASTESEAIGNRVEITGSNGAILF